MAGNPSRQTIEQQAIAPVGRSAHAQALEAQRRLGIRMIQSVDRRGHDTGFGSNESSRAANHRANGGANDWHHGSHECASGGPSRSTTDISLDTLAGFPAKR
jgi:hypothetical protein